MSVLDFFERIQNTGLSQWISGSIWGYPIVGALHVLAIALFGGAVLVTDLRLLGLAFKGDGFSQLAGDLRPWRRIGLLLVVLTGMLLFISQPVRYSGSVAFRVKMVLLALALLNDARVRPSARISLALWTAMIVAARGIAFF
jgi:hypothetical protein